jgi:DNA (cytosine-5)-methyltransferase 1
MQIANSPYTANNDSEFLCKSVTEIKGEHLEPYFTKCDYKLLAGCAPCQPFSTYSHGWSSPDDHRWHLLLEFNRLIEETKPELVTMENVPKLQKMSIFQEFVASMESLGYAVDHRVFVAVILVFRSAGRD